jgi:hypothetical protein
MPCGSDAPSLQLSFRENEFIMTRETRFMETGLFSGFREVYVTQWDNFQTTSNGFEHGEKMVRQILKNRDFLRF